MTLMDNKKKVSPEEQKPKKVKKSLYFSAAEFFALGQRSVYNIKEDLEFMNVVDVALHNKGRKWTYVLASSLVALFFIAFLSSFFIERKEVTRAIGQVVPSKGVHPVQTEGGIIETILVRENDLVEKEQVLGTIANVKAVSEYQTMLNRKVEYELRIQRFDAELNDTELVFSQEIQDKYPLVVQDQMNIFETSRAEFKGKEIALTNELNQRRTEVEESQLRLEQYQKTLLLLIQQQNRILPLVQNKTYSEVEYLGLKQRIVGIQGELNNLAGQISKIKSIVQEAESKLSSLNTERQAEILQEKNKTRQELNSIEQMLLAGAAAVQKTSFRSHIRGTVKRILMRPGSVVRPADLIMEIVPIDDGLEIEARFDPNGRGYLQVGQDAIVKVSAFDFTEYGTLSAKVVSISADTITDSKGGAWYEVRLRTTSESLFAHGEEFPIKVGMTVTVDVISSTRSLFSYLAKPLFKTLYRSSAIGQPADNLAIPAKE